MKQFTEKTPGKSKAERARALAGGWLITLARPTKRVILVVLDAVVLSFSFWIAMMLRYGLLDFPKSERLYLLYILLPIAGVAIFWTLGLYRSLLRSMEWQVLRIIALGSLLTTLLIPFVAYIDLEMLVPRSVPFIYFMLVVMVVGAVRVILREIYRLLIAKKQSAVRVMIYGAGNMGTQLAALLQDAPEYQLVGFIDDDPALRGLRIRGRRVRNVADVLNNKKERPFDEVFLAFHDPSQRYTRAAVQRLEGISVPIKTVPRVADMVRGNGSLDSLRDLRIEDLLGRQTVEPIPGLINGGLTGKSVMVTGAAGSIGSELCRQIIEARPHCLIAFDVSEIGLYTLEQELASIARSLGVDFHIKLGSVVSKELLDRLLMQFGIQILYHAAAYKHVPMVEDNIAVAVENNVFGTFNCAQAAADAAIERFVLVSTDKAVRPTNVMGATKRLGERLVQSMQGSSKSTIFSMVRFGNVLGSSGSVIPLFSKQIEYGGPITLTHRQVTRYFMTISEAAQLVLQAGFLADGGEVFLLDMGEPVRLEDLARLMVQLAGKKVSDSGQEEGSIEIKEVGLRPGEKLFEELLISDNALGTSHPKIMQARDRSLTSRQAASLLKSLRQALDRADEKAVRDLLRKHADMIPQSG